MASSSAARDPVQVLIDEPDPVARSRAHLTLGERALARDDKTAAADHLREAIDLDPTDERPKELLQEIAPEKPSRWGAIGRFFRKPR